MSTPAADPFVATFWKWVADSDRQKNELLASEFPKHIHRVVKDYVQSAYEERSKWEEEESREARRRMIRDDQAVPAPRAHAPDHRLWLHFLAKHKRTLEWMRPVAAMDPYSCMNERIDALLNPERLRC